MSKQAFEQINGDTAAANRGVVPDVLVDTYGNKDVPDAARFGKGTSTTQGAQQAQDARRNATPGAFDHKS